MSKMNYFVEMKKDFLSSPKLSLKAKGVLMFIQSYIEETGFMPTKSLLLKSARDGKKSLDSAYKELIEKGYIKPITDSVDGGK